MINSVYLAKNPHDLLSHFVKNKGETIAVFTEEFCYAKRVTCPTEEIVKEVFSQILKAFDQHHAKCERRDILINVQGVKRESVFSMVSFTRSLCGDGK